MAFDCLVHCRWNQRFGHLNLFIFGLRYERSIHSYGCAASTLYTAAERLDRASAETRYVHPEHKRCPLQRHYITLGVRLACHPTIYSNKRKRDISSTSRGDLEGKHQSAETGVDLYVNDLGREDCDQHHLLLIWSCSV